MKINRFELKDGQSSIDLLNLSIGEVKAIACKVNKLVEDLTADKVINAEELVDTLRNATYEHNYIHIKWVKRKGKKHLVFKPAEKQDESDTMEVLNIGFCCGSLDLDGYDENEEKYAPLLTCDFTKLTKESPDYKLVCSQLEDLLWNEIEARFFH